jgi:hypothetical protein
MSQHADQTQSNDDGFSEPSEEVKRRNRITAVILALFIAAIVASAVFIRIYGS